MDCLTFYHPVVAVTARYMIDAAVTYKTTDSAIANTFAPKSALLRQVNQQSVEKFRPFGYNDVDTNPKGTPTWITKKSADSSPT